MRVIVIGAGLGGLSAAAHLSNRGHEITIFERSSLPGGRAGLVTADGFRLDNGPTVLTMPNLLAEAFNAAGADMADFVTIKPVDPMYRAVYADGSTLFVRHGREAMTEEIRAFAGAKEAAAFGRFCDWLTELYRAEMPSFIDANFDSPLDLLKPWRAGLELVKLGGFGRLGRKVASFFDDERLRRIFSFQSMYAGLAPYEALALYAVITYMDSVEGVFVPVGGMHMMGAGLAAAVTKAGVDIRYDTAVSSITRAADGRITGVVVEGGRARRGRRRRVQRRPSGGIPRVARRPRGAAGGARRPVLAVVCAVDRRRARPAAAGCRPSQHPLRCRLGRLVPGTHPRRGADARPLDPRHAAQPRRPHTRTAGLLEPLRARTDTEPRQRPDRLGERTRPDRRRPAAPDEFARVSDRRRRRGGVRPDRLGTHGHGTRHPVRTRPYVPPDRAVPAEQRQPQGARARVHGFVDAARRRRAHGARVGQAGRGSASTSTPQRDAARDGALVSPCGCRSDTDHAAAAEWSPDPRRELRPVP